MKSLVRFALAASLVAGSATLAFAADIALDQPWSRATPAGAQVGAGYVTIRNAGKTADKLVSVTSDVSAKSEIHEMAMADGVMKMRAVSAIEVPAGQSAELKPGGYHIMFVGLKQPLKEGDTVKGSLTFEKAGPVPVEFKVRAMGAPAGDHKH
jgi:copper(I)-binding protein